MRNLIVLSGLAATMLYAVGACRFSPEGDDTGDSPVDTSDTEGDTDADADGDTDTDTDSDTDADTDEPWPWPTDTEFIVTAVDDETWAEDDYITLTYNLHPEADEHYDSILEGEDATFYLMVPEDVQPTEELTILTWFHGGAIGDDSDPENLPDRCTAEKVMGNALKAVQDELLPTSVARKERWAVLIPRNDWCDSWLGDGPSDPVDPQRHYSQYHVGRVLDFIHSGDAGFQPSGELYGWGTSMGGTAAIVAAHRHPRFTGLVIDSPPSSMFLYYELNTFGEDDIIMEHILGGPPYDEKGQPTEWYDNYYWASAETIIASGEMQVPMYVIWNSEDQLCDPPHVEVLIEAMNTTYPADVRHGEHDLDHRSPGDQYHTQSTSPLPPQGYSGALLIDSLEGAWLTWTEVEDGCQGDLEGLCTVGEVLDQDAIETISDYSRGAVRIVTPADGAGVAYCGHLPEGFEAGDQLRATAIVVARGIGTTSPDDPVLTLTYAEGEVVAEQALGSADFMDDGAGTVSSAMDQYEATAIEFVVADPTQGTLCARVEGEATLYLDSIVYAKRD